MNRHIFENHANLEHENIKKGANKDRRDDKKISYSTISSARKFYKMRKMKANAFASGAYSNAKGSNCRIQ